MPKVDLEEMERLEKEYREAYRKLIKAGLYCYKCGETKPKDGFFPLSCTLWGFSNVKCNECARKES